MLQRSRSMSDCSTPSFINLVSFCTIKHCFVNNKGELELIITRVVTKKTGREVLFFFTFTYERVRWRVCGTYYLKKWRWSAWRWKLPLGRERSDDVSYTYWLMRKGWRGYQESGNSVQSVRSQLSLFEAMMSFSCWTSSRMRSRDSTEFNGFLAKMSRSWGAFYR